MKKAIAMLMTLTLIFTLAGCAQDIDAMRVLGSSYDYVYADRQTTKPTQQPTQQPDVEDLPGYNFDTGDSTIMDGSNNASVTAAPTSEVSVDADIVWNEYSKTITDGEGYTIKQVLKISNWISENDTETLSAAWSKVGQGKTFPTPGSMGFTGSSVHNAYLARINYDEIYYAVGTISAYNKTDGWNITSDNSRSSTVAIAGANMYMTMQVLFSKETRNYYDMSAPSIGVFGTSSKNAIGISMTSNQWGPAPFVLAFAVDKTPSHPDGNPSIYDCQFTFGDTTFTLVSDSDNNGTEATEQSETGKQTTVSVDKKTNVDSGKKDSQTQTKVDNAKTDKDSQDEHDVQEHYSKDSEETCEDDSDDYYYDDDEEEYCDDYEDDDVDDYESDEDLEEYQEIDAFDYSLLDMVGKWISIDYDRDTITIQSDGDDYVLSAHFYDNIDFDAKFTERNEYGDFIFVTDDGWAKCTVEPLGDAFFLTIEDNDSYFEDTFGYNLFTFYYHDTPAGLFKGNYEVIQYGDSGSRVNTLQCALKDLGFTITDDSYEFGPSTRVAVIEFQQLTGLTADGKAGKKTLTMLESYFDDDGNLIKTLDIPSSSVDTVDSPSYTAEYVTATLNQQASTRSGPGTDYDETGTYCEAGDDVKIYGKAWDDRNDIWWYLIEFDTSEGLMRAYTGAKRFDISSDSIVQQSDQGEECTITASGSGYFGPSTDYKEYTDFSLAEGDSVTVCAYEDDWAQIEYYDYDEDIKRRCWIKRDMLSSDTTDTTDTTEVTPEPTSSTNMRYNVGDIVSFGEYKADSEGTEIADIDWLVLEADDEKALMISVLGLDVNAINDDESTDNTDTTWENCSLRSWLNDDFYNAAFDSDQKKQIVQTQVTTYDQNGKWVRCETMDNIFLLSVDEAERYFEDDESRSCDFTDYVIDKADEIAHGEDYWWLRTESGLAGYFAIVKYDGSIDAVGEHVTYARGIIRPALWITQSDVE